MTNTRSMPSSAAGNVRGSSRAISTGGSPWLRHCSTASGLREARTGSTPSGASSSFAAIAFPVRPEDPSTSTRGFMGYDSDHRPLIMQRRRNALRDRQRLCEPLAESDQVAARWISTPKRECADRWVMPLARNSLALLIVLLAILASPLAPAE